MTTEEIVLAKVLQLLRNCCGGYSEFEPSKDNPSYPIYLLCSQKLLELHLKKIILSKKLSNDEFINLIKICTTASKTNKMVTLYKNNELEETHLTNINFTKLSNSQMKQYIRSNTKKVLTELPTLTSFNNYNEKVAYIELENLLKQLLPVFDLQTARIDLLESLLKLLLRLNFKLSLKEAKAMLDNNNSTGKRLTDKEIAKVLNITPASYSEYMNAKSLPELENLVKLSKYIEFQLGTNSISYDFLLGNIQKPTHEAESLYKDFGLSEESYRIMQILKTYPQNYYKFITDSLNLLIKGLHMETIVKEGMQGFIDVTKEEELLEILEKKANEIDKNTSIEVKWKNGYQYKEYQDIRIFYSKTFKLIRQGTTEIKKKKNMKLYKGSNFKITYKENMKIIEKNGIKNRAIKGQDYRYIFTGTKDLDVLSAVGRFLQFNPSHVVHVINEDEYDYFRMSLDDAENKEDVEWAIEDFFQELYGNTGQIDMLNIRMMDVQRRLEAYRSYLQNNKKD
ncbi:MAG: helix-turn-helix domain-containing protein [Marinisporobacter sp.]|jgi:transcriptional regulator with XRE-family HTH domain|nr:helix-turn-helix domain-containing protein [Marinisporobacter sp.]